MHTPNPDEYGKDTVDTFDAFNVYYNKEDYLSATGDVILYNYMEKSYIQIPMKTLLQIVGAWLIRKKQVELENTYYTDIFDKVKL